MGTRTAVHWLSFFCPQSILGSVFFLCVCGGVLLAEFLYSPNNPCASVLDSWSYSCQSGLLLMRSHKTCHKEQLSCHVKEAFRFPRGSDSSHCASVGTGCCFPLKAQESLRLQARLGCFLESLSKLVSSHHTLLSEFWGQSQALRARCCTPC